jgi:hypothetical protein
MSFGKIKIDPADKAFSQWIRLRDKQCLRCGSKVKLRDELPISHHASHFQGRGKENTRFNELNVCTLCYGCHQFFTSHPGDHYQWQVKRLGQDTVDQLILASNTYCKKDRKLQQIYWEQELKKVLD